MNNLIKKLLNIWWWLVCFATGVDAIIIFYLLKAGEKFTNLRLPLHNMAKAVLFAAILKVIGLGTIEYLNGKRQAAR